MRNDRLDDVNDLAYNLHMPVYLLFCVCPIMTRPAISCDLAYHCDRIRLNTVNTHRMGDAMTVFTDRDHPDGGY